MRFDDAVKVWGARRLETAYADRYWWNTCENVDVDEATVTVTFDFDEGYACCGGSDPDCYCSFAESPRADVVIDGRCRTCMAVHRDTISAEGFNFVAVLGEIVDASGGLVTS